MYIIYMYVAYTYTSAHVHMGGRSKRVTTGLGERYLTVHGILFATFL